MSRTLKVRQYRLERNAHRFAQYYVDQHNDLVDRGKRSNRIIRVSVVPNNQFRWVVHLFFADRPDHPVFLGR